MLRDFVGKVSRDLTHCFNSFAWGFFIRGPLVFPSLRCFYFHVSATPTCLCPSIYLTSTTFCLLFVVGYARIRSHSERRSFAMVVYEVRQLMEYLHDTAYTVPCGPVGFM